MEPSPDPQLTLLLQQGSAQEHEVIDLVYEELRAMARSRMRQERDAHTLQATALVNEACMRLLGQETDWQNRRHFFGAASEAMRRVLVDHARKVQAAKRGSGEDKVTLGVPEAPVAMDAAQLLALDEAFRVLESQDVQAAEVTRLRFYSGLSVQEAAEVLGVTVRTIHRKWTVARARLASLLGDQQAIQGAMDSEA